jgi:hypothetical protein
MIVGVDFGAPQRARDQRRKIIAIAAHAMGERRYRIDATGMNARLLAHDPPGWTAQEIVDQLVAHPARVVGFDFPFGIPHGLLRDPAFAAVVGFEHGAFVDWRSFNAWIARRLPLTDPVDFSPFAGWRDRSARARLWSKRATDIAARAQPPLKDHFQATFQMTLLGNAVLAKLWESRHYRVLPFPGGDGLGEVIEVYPGATLRALGRAHYKSTPGEAVQRALGACAAAGLALAVAPSLLELARRYSSGTAQAPDHDVADAFVALCTALLHAERACHPVLAPDPAWDAQLLMEREGAIWLPTSGPIVLATTGLMGGDARGNDCVE